jgi:membrane protein DedA with SNARE-associated domain
MDQVLHWVSQYGYAGIILLLMFGIVGLPVPDEWLLMFTGFLVHRGSLSLAPAVASAFFGSACGITVSYALGRTLGVAVICRYGRLVHLDQGKLEKVGGWFDRIGKWTLLAGYFVPGVRHLTAFVAGTSSLRYPVFSLFAYIGALLWVSCFVTLGYVFGEEWKTVAEWIRRNHWLISGVGVAVLLVWFLLWRWYAARGREA